jgi:SET domain-containing protein
MLEIRYSKKYGRGIYATRAIKDGTLIEASPVLILDSWECARIEPTILNCYVFAWGDEDVDTAIAFGYGSLFNHSRRENTTYKPNYDDKTIEYIALRNIKKGEQLFINYGYSAKSGIKATKKNRTMAIEREKNGT